MREAPLRHVIAALGDVGRPAMLQKYGPDSCIAATAIAIEAAEAYGHHGSALAVEARIFNASLAAWMRAGRAGEPPADGYERDAGVVESPVVGPGGLTSGRELHIVAYLWEGDGPGGYVVDLALDQGNHSRHALAAAMVLEPSSFEVRAEHARAFLTGEPKAWMEDDGLLFAYRVRPDCTWWRSSPNFGRRDAAIRARIVGAVVRALDAGHGRSDA